MSKNTESTEVTQVSEEKALVRHQANRGFENMDIDSVKIPIARLLQPISKEVADEEYAEYGFRAGQLIHSLLLEKLSDTFIPLTIKDDKIMFVPKQDAAREKMKQVVRAKLGVELTDDDLKSSFVCRADDNITGSRFGKCADCGLCEFSGNDAPLCNKNVNVLSVFADQPLPLIVRFSSTSHKHGRAFKNLAYFSGGDLFSRKYRLSALKKTEKNNTWYELSAKPAGKCTEDEFETAEATYNMFKNLVIEVVEPAGEEPTSSTVETKEF